jgi:uncharacterized protein YndB with AHSA1/START domain
MDGTLSTVAGRPTLRFERRLRHPIGKVWRAISDPAELPAWFPWLVEIDARVGGRIGFTHPTGAATAPDAVITELDPPHVLAYRWGDGDLRWALTEDGDGCVLVFTHTFTERSVAAKTAAGWHVSLDALLTVLAGRPVGSGNWPVLNARYVSAFGLLDGTVVDGDLRFEQELVVQPDVVWAALAGDARLGAAPPSTCTVPGGPTGPVTELRPAESLAYGTVRFELVPQDFGTRVVLTQRAPGAGLAAARSAWHDRLVSFAEELHRRPVGG